MEINDSDFFEFLVKKLDSLVQNSNDMKITLERQHASLAEHIRRSESLERAVEIMEEKHAKDMLLIEQQLKPLKYLDGTIKVVIGASVVAGAIVGIYELFDTLL